MRERPLNPNIYNPETIWGCSYWAYIILLIVWIPPVAIIALVGWTPLPAMGLAFLNYLSFFGLTAKDPFWAERFIAWLESLRSTPGTSLRVFDYNAG